MEEGPEPQELLEEAEHHFHEKHEEAEAHNALQKSRHLRSAVTAAILAVCAALGSILSGHAVNQAILLQTKASDQWAYYQAKSTKAHLYEINKTMLATLLNAGKPDDKNSAGAARMNKTIELFGTKMQTYAVEEHNIQTKAQDLERESAHEFEIHQLYSIGIACFQISIVFASMAILVEAPLLYAASIAGGIIGLLVTVVGLIK